MHAKPYEYRHIWCDSVIGCMIIIECMTLSAMMGVNDARHKRTPVSETCA